ncbi:uncharacterized protein Bfra_000561 [Botrytis fragariae]|uniref:Uncharacterized protein n=1 Tax=Botrytis fragariae TaxID=1964551 RepID=A0A8H6B2U8_9HELO|nr:uncharacterized protein Bfra_000561 [Botrytis fragariae]KAF5878396.1 hypothetical protein Bfra_000561 [Botrytis fragariae]
MRDCIELGESCSRGKSEADLEVGVEVGVVENNTIAQASEPERKKHSDDDEHRNVNDSLFKPAKYNPTLLLRADFSFRDPATMGLFQCAEEIVFKWWKADNEARPRCLQDVHLKRTPSNVSITRSGYKERRRVAEEDARRKKLER